LPTPGFPCTPITSPAPQRLFQRRVEDGHFLTAADEGGEAEPW
jgi:hypothetical protein